MTAFTRRQRLVVIAIDVALWAVVLVLVAVSGPPGEKHPWATGFLYVGLAMTYTLIRVAFILRRKRRERIRKEATTAG